MTISYRRARDLDFEQIVHLQNLYLEANLNTDQKQDGFLSGQFTTDQFCQIDADGAVVVAYEQTDDGSDVKAFLCASSPAFNLPFALPRAMIESFPQAIFEGKPLSQQAVLVAGPVCVDVSCRGKGLVRELYRAISGVVPDLYEVVVVFVSVANLRSINAHKNLGMSVVSGFSFNEKEYVTMACSIANFRG
ncbi:MAG: hypothetical protein WCT03_12735 [Candidatus Obscuribacterales bacterium]|jgi:hypothetical protein